MVGDTPRRKGDSERLRLRTCFSRPRCRAIAHQVCLRECLALRSLPQPPAGARMVAALTREALLFPGGRAWQAKCTGLSGLRTSIPWAASRSAKSMTSTALSRSSRSVDSLVRIVAEMRFEAKGPCYRGKRALYVTEIDWLVRIVAAMRCVRGVPPSSSRPRPRGALP